MKATLELSGMKFHACIGCLDFEKRDGNDFIVDFSAQLDITDAAKSDNLEDALDYSLIYEEIKKQMDQSANLLENAASRILDAVASAFPALENIHIRISKLNPPLSGPVASSSITLTR